MDSPQSKRQLASHPGPVSKNGFCSPMVPKEPKLLPTPLCGRCGSRYTPNKYAAGSPGCKETFSDRFIPMRTCTNLSERFLTEAESKCHKHAESPSHNESPTAALATTASASARANAKAYSTLLKAQVLNEGGANSDEDFGVRRTLRFVEEPKLEPIEERKGESEVGSWSPCRSPQGRTAPQKPFLEFHSAQKRGTGAQSRAFAISPLRPNPFPDSAALHSRKFPSAPNKVLDAPGLEDDFYLNVLDWGSNDLLAVGLGNVLYTLREDASKVDKTLELPETTAICSLAFSPTGKYLNVGLSSGTTHLLDAETGKLLHKFQGHEDKVSCCSWRDGNVFSTGSRDGCILDRDVRSKADSILLHTGHSQEVCGLKWSFDQRYLASGGNDNRVLLWTLHSPAPLLRLPDHTAAVKALAWSPLHTSLLATGGGTADRSLKFWDAPSGRCIRSVDTGAQVCSLMFSRSTSELVSTQGYSENSVVVWQSEGLHRLATLSGHMSRVLYLAMSPNGDTIVTGAGDETLRFWSLFPPLPIAHPNSPPRSPLFPSATDLR